MLEFLSIFELNADGSADILVASVDGKFDFGSRCPLHFEILLVFFGVEFDIDFNSAGESPEKGCHFVLRSQMLTIDDLNK